MGYISDESDDLVLDDSGNPISDSSTALLIEPTSAEEWRPINVETIDLQPRANGRLLWQFRRSPVLLSILHAIITEIQSCLDMLLNIQRMRMPTAATGENLDAIGRIVGQDRVLIDYSERIWMRPDTANQGPDISPVWTTGAPRYESARAEDWIYSILIRAKVFRNFCRYGSTLEIQSAALRAFNVNISFQDHGETLLVPSDVPLHILGFLTEERTNANVDAYYLPPYPATMRINKEMFLYPDTFRPDRESGVPDLSTVTTGFVF